MEVDAVSRGWGSGVMSARFYPPNPDEWVEELELVTTIRRLLKGMGRDGEVVAMSFGVGMDRHTYEEIGDSFGFGRSWARKTTQRGLRRLRHPGLRRHLQPFLDPVCEDPKARADRERIAREVKEQQKAAVAKIEREDRATALLRQRRDRFEASRELGGPVATTDEALELTHLSTLVMGQQEGRVGVFYSPSGMFFLLKDVKGLRP